MAIIIKEMPKKRTPGRTPKYPWAEWLDGRARLLEQGVDFDGKVASIRQQAYKMAREHAVKVSLVSVDSSTVAIQATKLR